jgi:hypothetical protein
MASSQILTKNTALAGKIQELTGMPAQQARTGFKNAIINSVRSQHRVQDFPFLDSLRPKQ